MCIYVLCLVKCGLKCKLVRVFTNITVSKIACNTISHWTLFKKLIDWGVPLYLVMILGYWYPKQEMTVSWGACISYSFEVTNGVRQGGILSLQLFNIYIDGLSNILYKSSIGGSIDGKQINHMLYADDLCIVSSVGLQQLLSICDQYCAMHFITFNVKISVCIFLDVV